MNDYKLTNLEIISCNYALNKLKDRREEFNDSNLIFTDIYCTLNILEKNKSCIIKMFLPFNESMIISILYLLVNIFNEVNLIKPSTSELNSSEIYCVCKGYIGYENINLKIKNRMKKLLKNYDANNSIFPIDQIEKKFIDQLILISKLFVDRQINSIKNILCLRNIYYDDYEIQKQITELKD